MEAESGYKFDANEQHDVLKRLGYMLEGSIPSIPHQNFHHSYIAIPSSVKEAIYLLYHQDRKKWNHRALANFFGLRIERIRAIIKLINAR